MARELRLDDLPIRPQYDSTEDSPLQNFYIPCLENSVRYDRAVGYFSSAILSVLTDAFTNFSSRGGKMRLICSPILSAGDAETLEVISAKQSIATLNERIDQLDLDGVINKPLDLMAHLIQSNCLELKFAIPLDITSGIFHQKIGNFADGIGNRVAFSGSNNESISGWMDLRNSESFSVYTSWRDDNDEARANDIQQRFERMWNNQYRGFEIVDFTSAIQFVQRRQNTDLDPDSVRGEVRSWVDARVPQKHQKSGGLRPYQSEVIADWETSGNSGIVCFATGAGKTRTALAAIDRWRGGFEKRAVLVLVPSERLQRQWKKEFEERPEFDGVSILLAGGIAPGPKWRDAIRDITSFRRHSNDGIVIAVNDTASGESFTSRVEWGRHLLVVADEVHNLGAPSYSDLLAGISKCATIGLSATPERYNEDETQTVRDTFGADLRPVVDIQYAQSLGVLVEYRYRFLTVGLDPEEKIRYQELTRKIGALANSGDSESSSKIQLLAAQRGNVLKGAEAKISVAAELLRKHYKDGNSWIVFCNDIAQLNQLKEAIGDLAPLDFHGEMEGDKASTLKYFAKNGGILLSIHMLDEGVDIPSIDHCLLIASSQSKREFIQRRGRVLRANPLRPKGYAEIWDLIVVDEDGKAFVDAEITRAMEFGGTAMNPSVINDLNKLRRVSATPLQHESE